MTTTANDLNVVTGEYQIDPAHSRLGFVARHAMVTKVRGHFPEVSGTLYLDAEDPSRSTAEVVVQMASVNTGQDQRDAHLRSPDFFDVENHPTWTFTSTGVRLDGDDIIVDGDLSIKGVTKNIPLTLEVNGFGPDAWGGTRVGFSGLAQINRSDFGVDISMPLDGGGVVVSEKVQIALEIEGVLRTA